MTVRFHISPAKWSINNTNSLNQIDHRNSCENILHP